MTRPPADDQAARARKVQQALAAAEFYDAVDDDVARVLADEVKRLQARTHEIQAQEMAKRAALDSELAEWRQRYESAKRWTEDNELRAEWASGEFAAHPFWSMTSYNARSALLRLVTERDESCARVAAVRALADQLVDAAQRESEAERLALEILAVLDGPAEAPEAVRQDPTETTRVTSAYEAVVAAACVIVQEWNGERMGHGAMRDAPFVELSDALVAYGDAVEELTAGGPADEPTQQDVAAWLIERFGPERDLIAQGEKLHEETAEAIIAIRGFHYDLRMLAPREGWAQNLRDETADVVICCMAIAVTVGFDLDEAVAAKWSRRKRGAALAGSGGPGEPS